MKLKSMLAGAAAAAILTVSGAVIPVHADGYWTEGWWDDPTQTWHDGYWTETGSSDTWTDTSAASTTSAAGWMQYYSQTDSQWAGVVIGNASTIANNGCVPTAGAMVLSHFGISQTPLDVAYSMNSWGDYNADYGHGADSNAWNNLAANYGFSAWGCYSAEDTIGALGGGALVAACVNAGAGTHCVVLTGVDGNGNTTVYDPYGGIYSSNVYSLWNNRSSSWVDTVGGGPFIALQ